MILYESPSMKVHIYIYQLLHFYHKVNDLAKIISWTNKSILDLNEHMEFGMCITVMLLSRYAITI